MSASDPPTYRIPKIPVTVEVNLGTPGIRRVEIFVAEHVADAFRRQHVADLLASPERFLPAREPGAANASLFNKAVAVWIRIPTSEGGLPVEESSAELEELFEQQHPVEVELASGEVVRGDLLYSLPSDRSRVADYLNRGDRFFRLWTTDFLYLVNKDHVVRVQERERT